MLSSAPAKRAVKVKNKNNDKKTGSRSDKTGGKNEKQIRREMLSSAPAKRAVKVKNKDQR